MTQEQLPPGEYMCKIVDATIEPGRKPGDLKAMLTVAVPALGDAKIKVEAAHFHGNVLNQDDIERLARVAWENTGKESLPVLPPGQVWIDKATNKQVDPKDLALAWEQIGTKEIFRRQAAAVAKALGFKLGDDVTVTPRDLIKGAQAPLRKEIAKLLVQHIVQSMEKESALLQPVPQVFMRDPYALLDLIRKEANVSSEEIDAWMLEAQPNRRGGRPGA